MQSLHTRFCKAETRSKRTNSVENIWSFRILIDLILWQILVKSKKFDFAFFASMYARNACRAFDALSFLSISRSFDIFYELSTVKLHRYWIIDVANNIWKFWNSQWCYMMWFAFSFVIALLRQLIFVSWCIVYSILDIRFHIDVSFRENTFRTSSNARSHVIQFDFTSYLKSINHRISNRSFLQSSYRIYQIEKVCSKVSDNASLKKSHRWKSHIVEKISSRVEKVCTKTSNWTR